MQGDRELARAPVSEQGEFQLTIPEPSNGHVIYVVVSGAPTGRELIWESGARPTGDFGVMPGGQPGSTAVLPANANAIPSNATPVAVAGAAGARSQQGPVGASGPQGVAGPPGPSGPQGETGAVGPQGPPGTEGWEGEEGPRGRTSETSDYGIYAMAATGIAVLLALAALIAAVVAMARRTSRPASDPASTARNGGEITVDPS